VKTVIELESVIEVKWLKCNETTTTKKVTSFFTALHGMQMRSSDENSVCASVCPSVKRVNCDKTEERSVQIFIPYEISFSLVF